MRPHHPSRAPSRATTPAAQDQSLPREQALAEDSAAPAPSEHRTGQAWQEAAARARLLSWVSLVWMSAEGLVGLVAGIQAQSISLLGWALGSVIEGRASVVVIWRFTGTRTLSETAEARARKAVAVSFFLLAPYLTVGAVRDLLGGHQSSPSGLGMAVTAASLVFMPLLGIAKKRLGAVLDSAATAGEGVQNLMCAAQAGAVLLGLAGTAALGWTWLDPAIALLLAGWAIREGREAWRGDDCC
jgi:divalent metal cation (Fe/Co/Zn/Cd) transporter